MSRCWTSCLLLVLFCVSSAFSENEDPRCLKQKTYVNTFREGRVDSLIYADTEDYKIIFALLSLGDLYRSDDGAKTFSKVAGLPRIDELFKSPDPKKFYALDETGVFWISTDTGKTFSRRDSQQRFTHPVVHPINSDWILAGSPPCNSLLFCSTTLYVSQDFAQTWREVKKLAVDPWSWGDAGKYGIPAETVHMMYGESNTSTTFTYGQTKNLGKTMDYTIPNAIALLSSDQNFFVAQSTPAGKLTLYAGPSNAPQFKPCVFPETLPQNRYSILDTSGGSTFINVEHGGYFDRAWGHTYVANSFANPRFSLSLTHNRRQGGKVDFARVKGVNGVYIANQWAVKPGASQVPRDAPLESYISFNNGGKWTRLAKPTNVPCDNCTGLNLIGRSNRRNIPSFYTTSKAVGLILAAGNVLPTLLDTAASSLDTYFSRDAGLTWERVRTGAHLYQFLDHGGIIALVDFTNPTTKYAFTFNEGLKWYDCSISGLDKPVQINSLSYPPQATHLSFHMIGEKNDGGSKGVIITVDFSELHDTVCDSAKDYEVFSPHDTSKCLLGAKMTYRRRKRESECFNSDQIENNTIVERCPCTRDDWECDICYEESSDGTCIKMKSAQCDSYQESPPADCQGQYPAGEGYRLAGSKCDPYAKDAVNKYRMKDCPASHSSSSGAKVGVIVAVLVVIVALIGFIFYRRRTNESFREKTDEYWERFTGLFRSNERSSGYSSVGGRGGEPQDLDDDEGLLSADSDYKRANNVGNGERDDFI